MFAKRDVAVVVAILMTTSMAMTGIMAVSTPVSASEESDDGYASTHITFETAAEAITQYGVNDIALVSAIAVESTSEAEERGVIGADVSLSSATTIEASGLSVASESETRAAVTAESGAELVAHDSQRGHLVIHAGESGQFVSANLSSGVSAEQVDDSRVVVAHEDGTEGTFILVGDGELAINEDGNVVASIEQDSVLTYQQYEGERNEDDDEREQLSADGTAVAEVFVTMASEGGEAVADVAQFSHDTTVDVVTYSENEVHVTAERAESEGRIIVVSIAEQAVTGVDDMTVNVDGEAAGNVESASELEAAAAGGDKSAYLIRHTSTAEASSDVLVAVNHFSERDIVVRSAAADDETPTDDGDDALPGFGIAAAGLALLVSALLALRRW